MAAENFKVQIHNISNLDRVRIQTLYETSDHNRKNNAGLI